MDRKYNISVQVYNENAFVPVDTRCFAYMFTNVGDTTARVNGMVLFPSATPATAIGDSRTIAAHRNELYKGNITLQFAAGGAAPAVEIVQLFYID